VEIASRLASLDRRQQRTPVLAVPVAVYKKFLDDGVDKLGVQVAYWAFFSVFALLLAFSAILGFVFDNNPSLQRQLLNSTLDKMPVIGPQIRGDIGTLTGSGVALAVGVIGAVWTGLGVTLAIGRALDLIWAVPRPRRSGYVASRVRGLLVLVSVGSIQVVSTVAVVLATAGGAGSTATRVLSLLGSAVFDLVLFVASFRLLTAADITVRQVMPGAVLASALWLGLQSLGGVYVTKLLAGSSQTYGGFAAVVGLLAWLLLAAELVLIAAELNVVLARRLWPRSLTGDLLEADRHALRDAAEAAQLDRRQHITVSFERESPP
jgi:YihY family inner membrane protein